MFLAPLHNFKSDLCNLLNSSSAIDTSITSILKSLMMILAIWLALVGAFIQESHHILLYIASLQQPIRFQGLFKETSYIRGKWKKTFATFY